LTEHFRHFTTYNSSIKCDDICCIFILYRCGARGWPALWRLVGGSSTGCWSRACSCTVPRVGRPSRRRRGVHQRPREAVTVGRRQRLQDRIRTTQIHHHRRRHRKQHHDVGASNSGDQRQLRLRVTTHCHVAVKQHQRRETEAVEDYRSLYYTRTLHTLKQFNSLRHLAV